MPDLTSNLIHHWRLDEPSGATTFADSAGSNTLSEEGSVTAGVSAVIGNGVQLPGLSADYLSMASEVNLTGAFTLACWQNRDTPLSAAIIFGYGVDGDSYAVFLPVVSTTIIVNITGVTKFFTGIVPVTAGTFFHIALTRTAAGLMTFYIDGVAQADTETQTGTLNLDRIGNFDTTNQNPYGGILDEIRIYDRSLAVNDVTALAAFGEAPYTQSLCNLVPFNDFGF